MLLPLTAVGQPSLTNPIELERGKQAVCGQKVISNKSTAYINVMDTTHWTIELNISVGDDKNQKILVIHIEEILFGNVYKKYLLNT